MKITLDLLKHLTNDSEFTSIPSMLVEQNSRGQPWWMALNELQREGAKATIWEACQWIALLFDTYGDNIKTVWLTLNVDMDKSSAYMTSSVYVNDEQCYDMSIKLDVDVMMACQAVDGSDTLKYVVRELDEIGNSGLISMIHVMNEAFEEKFTSAEQARRVARKHAPEINSWFTTKLLERHAHESGGYSGQSQKPKVKI